MACYGHFLVDGSLGAQQHGSHYHSQSIKAAYGLYAHEGRKVIERQRASGSRR